MTTEDIKLVIKAFYKVNDRERSLHGEQGAFMYYQTESYWQRVHEYYIYLKYQQAEVEEKLFWEKAADEAQKAAKDTPSVDDFDKSKLLEEAMQDFVAESEDEKIRKLLIDFIRSYNWQRVQSGFNGKTKEEVIAWLEKQGEQKSIDTSEIEMKRHNEGYIKGVHDAYDNVNQARSILNQLRKERPKPEQKPVEWSEEEEQMLNQCCAAIHAADYYDLDDKNEMERWLKSLKNRVQPQPKVEWSEKDDEMYARIVRSYTSYEGRILNARDLSEDNRNNILEDLNEQELWLRDRLKSLRPQKQWKPSEEQMDALCTAADGFRPYEEKHKVLFSLYNDLKAL